MSENKNEKWPSIKEKKGSGKRVKKTREFTIKDARNTWEIVIEKVVDEYIFKLAGFERFYFVYGSKTMSLKCFKECVERVSDSGQIASHDDRFNLMNDQGERKTLRLKNFKEYLGKILND